MDEGQENLIHDCSGDGHTGTTHSTNWVTGHDGVGHALSFNNTHYVDVPNHEDLHPLQFTVEAWARWTGRVNQPFRYVATKYLNGNFASWGIYTGTPVGRYCYVSDGTAVTRVGPVGLLPAGWQHYVCFYDETYLRLWIDGAMWGPLSDHPKSGHS